MTEISDDSPDNTKILPPLPTYHGSRKRPPNECTPEIIDAICANLQYGVSGETAAQAEGVSRGTYYDWLRRYIYFAQAVKQAKAVAEIVLAARVKGGVTGYQGAAFILERRCARDWTKQDTLQINIPSLDQGQIDGLIPQALAIMGVIKPDSPPDVLEIEAETSQGSDDAEDDG